MIHSLGNKFNSQKKQTMKKIFVYMASAALMLAVSCNKEEVNVDTTAPVETELITVDLNLMTKTALGAEGATTWDADDEVSVTVGGESVGTLKLVEGSTFSGEIVAGLSGEAVLNYPAGVADVPTIQTAVAGSFADGAALLEGTTTVEDLRAGTGVELQNKTALLQFTVAQAGDVTFEVGEAKYTVTGCKTGSTYYACVTPVENASFVARIDGYLSKQASKKVTFTANKIANLQELPAPVKASWGIRGSFVGGSWDTEKYMYKDIYNSQVLKNVDFGSGAEFKFYNASNGWSGYNEGNNAGNGWMWISGGSGSNISASGKVDIYVNDSGWAFKIVPAGTSPF